MKKVVNSIIDILINGCVSNWTFSAHWMVNSLDLGVFFTLLFAWTVLLWQVYADYESNPLLRQGIEFCCRQFYILHRKPFILQLFASVAPLLEFTVRPLSTHTHTHTFFYCQAPAICRFLYLSFFIPDQHQYRSFQRSVSPVSVWPAGLTGGWDPGCPGCSGASQGWETSTISG